MSVLTLPLRFGLALCALVCASSAHAADAVWLDSARASITTGELHAHAGFLADDILEGREAGSRGGHAAAKYILERLQSTGLEPAGSNGGFTQRFPNNSQNILALLPGSDPELRDEYIVVGAHYDHVGYGNRRNSMGPIGYIHNGADDNASGVSTLLEVIDALSQAEHRPRRSILFAFWDGEEKGLLGSKYWLRHPTIPVSAVKLAWNIDMVGRLKDGRIEILGARTGTGLRQLLSSPALADGTWVDFNWEYKDNSDHWPFYLAGIPSLAVHTGLHDDYHRPSDDVEKLNIEGMRLVAGYFLEQLCETADADRLPEFRPQSRFETPFTQQRAEKPLPPLPPRLDFTWTYQAAPQPRVLVDRAPRGSLAEAAGLRAGDAILAVNGLPITSAELLPAVALRSESQLELTVVPASKYASGEAASAAGAPNTITLPLAGQPATLGLSWREDSAEPGTVYITRVVPHSPAALAGVEVLDRIHSLDGVPIAGQADLLATVQELLAANAASLRLGIESRGQLREVAVSLALPTQPAGDVSL